MRARSDSSVPEDHADPAEPKDIGAKVRTLTCMSARGIQGLALDGRPRLRGTIESSA
jgi:hypothetical protein